MDIAIVTGASKGIGLAISRQLITRNYKIYALARDFTPCSFNHDNFIKKQCDITDTPRLIETIKNIFNEKQSLNLLINNAGIGIFGPLETIEPKDIDKMVRTNLMAPIILTRLVLNRLKESNGRIINISSTAALTAKPMGAVYSATKAGLLNFGESLFEEIRKQGVAITTICPDMTSDTDFYRNSNFKPHKSFDTSIAPSVISDAVINVLNQPAGTVISHITIKPQRFQIEKK